MVTDNTTTRQTITMIKELTSILQYLRNCISNPGGINFRLSRYAGNLSNTSIGIDEYIAICHSLIFKNGVRKTTDNLRNVAAINDSLNKIGEKYFNKKIRILDIGASIGLTSRDNYNVISEKYDIGTYCLGDLYTKIYLDKETGTIFDQDYQVLQVKNNLFFYNMNFDYLNSVQKIINFPNHLLGSILRKSIKLKKENLCEIKLIIPELDYKNSPFDVNRMDVFKEINESYDLIICFHLLVNRYFSQDEIASATSNLIDALSPRGVLLVGASEEYKLIIKEQDGSILETLCKK